MSTINGLPGYLRSSNQTLDFKIFSPPSNQPTYVRLFFFLSNQQLHRAASMNDNDYYKDLGVTECASTEEIKSAFYALAKQYHPDKTGTNDGTDFRRVREAYDVLSDPVSRAAYDGDVQNTHSRTAQYEAEEGAKAGKYDRDHGPERADTDEDRSRYQKK